MLSKVLAAFLLLCAFAAHALEGTQANGSIRIAVYKNFPPFSHDNKGIDVDIANALAKKLGVKLNLMWVEADEDMEDDLRNAVWKGHYLGGGVADAMLHVPVDEIFAARNEQVKIFAPYYREDIQVARNVALIPRFAAVEQLSNQKIGVEIETASDSYLLSTMGGKLRPNIVHFRSGMEAVSALRAGEVAAVMGPRSELEAGLQGERERFSLTKVLAPELSVSGWSLGVAVKANNDALAKALDQEIASLARDGTIRKIFEKHGLTYVAPN